jgi:glutamate carboxypeptidase
MLSTLEALVRIESPTHCADSQARIFALLTTLLEDLNYHTEHRPAGTSGGLLYACPHESNPTEPQQLIVAHADTVWPHGVLKTRPFQIDEACAWGPGTYDTKAGIVQALFALRALRALGHVPSVTPIVVINSDEETGSAQSTSEIATLAKQACRAFVLEPSLGQDGHIKTARKGVGHFTLTVRGKAAHAGLDPDKGISATVEMSHVIQALNRLNDPETGLTVNIGEIRGGTRRNVIPAEAVAEVDVRAWTHADAAAITQKIRAIRVTLPGAELTIEGDFVKRPMEPNAAGKRLWTLAKQAATELGIPLEQAAAGGASDGNTTALYCPTLDGLGAVGDGAHANHEHVVIHTMAERAALLALLMLAPE